MTNENGQGGGGGVKEGGGSWSPGGEGPQIVLGLRIKNKTNETKK